MIFTPTTREPMKEKDTTRRENPPAQACGACSREAPHAGAGWQLRFVQLERGALDVNLSTLRSRGASVVTAKTNLSCHVAGKAPSGEVSIIVPLTLEKGFRLWGHEIDPDDLLLAGPGQEIDVVSHGPMEVVSVQVKIARLLEVSSTFGLGEAEIAGKGVRIFRVASGETSRLRALLEEVMHRPAGEERRKAEARLLFELCAAIASNRCEGAINSGNAPSRMVSVKAACDFMESHLGQPFKLRDVSAAAGVGLRSLQRSFRDVLGTTPMKYLRTRRLNRVRSALKRETSKSRSITDLAARCGFTHFGHFGVKYKEMFGETPSQTVRGKQPRDSSLEEF